MNNNRRTPFIATHPGELIKDEIKARGITQKRLSEISGISPSVLSETIKGRRSISLNMALALENSLDIPAEIWLNLQDQYDLDSTENNSRKPRSRFAVIRLLIENALKDSGPVTVDDRKEPERISSLLSDF